MRKQGSEPGPAGDEYPGDWGWLAAFLWIILIIWLIWLIAAASSGYWW